MRGRTPIGALAIAACLALAACGDDEPAPEPATTTSQADAPSDPAPDQAPQSEAEQPKPPEEGKESGPADGGTDDPRVTAAEREVVRAVRSFLAALDGRDFERACTLLAPGVLDAIELPDARGSCPASLEASVGYRDPRGVPVWEGVEAAEVRIAELDAESAKVVATVVTRFADREEPSIEDDIIYLAHAADRWLIAKPSSTLYRAVGIADIPPSVLTPP